MAITSEDLQNIKDLFKEILREVLNLDEGETFDQKLDKKLSHLPTKDEFYKQMDKITGELDTVRLEQKASAKILARHTDQIEKLQKIHPKDKHLIVA